MLNVVEHIEEKCGKRFRALTIMVAEKKVHNFGKTQ